jgi:hypothetical protein
LGTLGEVERVVHPTDGLRQVGFRVFGDREPGRESVRGRYDTQAVLAVRTVIAHFLGINWDDKVKAQALARVALLLTLLAVVVGGGAGIRPF